MSKVFAIDIFAAPNRQPFLSGFLLFEQLPVSLLIFSHFR
jgi:hypothetical protein